MFSTTPSTNTTTLRTNRRLRKSPPTKTFHASTPRPSSNSLPCVTTWSSTPQGKKPNFFLSATLLPNQSSKKWVAPLQPGPLWTKTVQTLSLREGPCSMRKLKTTKPTTIRKRSLHKFSEWLMKRMTKVVSIFPKTSLWKSCLWTQIYSYPMLPSISLSQHISKLKGRLMASKTSLLSIPKRIWTRISKMSVLVMPSAIAGTPSVWSCTASVSEEVRLVKTVTVPVVRTIRIVRGDRKKSGSSRWAILKSFCHRIASRTQSRTRPPRAVTAESLTARRIIASAISLDSFALRLVSVWIVST